jgi:hypothetical protein
MNDKASEERQKKEKTRYESVSEFPNIPAVYDGTSNKSNNETSFSIPILCLLYMRYYHALYMHRMLRDDKIECYTYNAISEPAQSALCCASHLYCTGIRKGFDYGNLLLRSTPVLPNRIFGYTISHNKSAIMMITFQERNRNKKSLHQF